ncbi:hypothetical protein HN51_004057 [Arachis hypogaea]|nr:uncharacterized protein DS421_4g113050 [Arachis hypogaea]
MEPPTPSLVSPLSTVPHSLVSPLTSSSSRSRAPAFASSAAEADGANQAASAPLGGGCGRLLVSSPSRNQSTSKKMRSGLIWATAEDLAKNRGRVLSLYRQILRSLNSPKLPLTFAARLAKKAEVRAMFWVGSDERSLHNIADLIDAAEYSLSFLKKGELPPRYIT